MYKFYKVMVFLYIIIGISACGELKTGGEKLGFSDKNESNYILLDSETFDNRSELYIKTLDPNQVILDNQCDYDITDFKGKYTYMTLICE